MTHHRLVHECTDTSHSDTNGNPTACDDSPSVRPIQIDVPSPYAPDEDTSDEHQSPPAQHRTIQHAITSRHTVNGLPSSGSSLSARRLTMGARMRACVRSMRTSRGIAGTIRILLPLLLATLAGLIYTGYIDHQQLLGYAGVNLSLHTALPPSVSLPATATRSISTWHQKLTHHSTLPFFLLWTTAASTFTLRQRAVIEQLLIFHPTNPVVVLSNTLPADFFDSYRQSGYDIEVRTYGESDLRSMTHGDPGVMEWVRRLDEWRAGPWFFSHITDFLRFSLLYEHGGSYLDFDALVLRPWSSMSSAVGQDRAGGKCSWCLPHNIYTAPGVMMNFPPKSPLMLEALRNGFAQPSVYDPTCFVCVGPRALTIAIRKHLELDTTDPSRGDGGEFPVDGVLRTNPLFTILDSFQLYPVNYEHITPLLRTQSHSYETWSKLRRRALSLHLFGKVTMDVPIETGSTVDLIIRDARLTCPEDTSERNKLHLTVPSFLELATREMNIPLKIPDLRLTDCAFFTEQAQARYRVTLAVHQGALITLPQARYPRSKIMIEGTVRQINEELSGLVYVPIESASGKRPQALSHFSPHVSDVLWISASDLTLFDKEFSRSISLHIPFLHVASLVTMTVKTFNRLDMVKRAVLSARSMYPGLPIIVADDSAQATNQIESIEKAIGQYFPEAKNYVEGATAVTTDTDPIGSTVFMRLPFDVGLSSARNSMTHAVTTPFFLLLDDDHVLDSNTDLGFLVSVLVASEFYDILAMTSPLDTEKWGFDFQGVMRQDNSTLLIEAGTHGSLDGCDIVDIAHNKFIARTDSVKRVLWDARLKLGEHEEFYWRAKLAGLHVGVCPSTSIQHRQPPHWLKRTAYDVQRSRVYAFFEIMLRIHGLECMKTFDHIPVCRQKEYADFTVDTQVCAIGFSGPTCSNCARGFHGVNCDQCSVGFFSTGCMECHCPNPDTICDDGKSGSGSCSCRCPPMLGPNLLLATPQAMKEDLASWTRYTEVRGGMPAQSGRVVMIQGDDPAQPSFRITNTKVGLQSGLYRTVNLSPAAVHSAALGDMPFEIVFSAIIDAEDVSGEEEDSNFSIYIDAWYADDGTPEWGKVIPIPSGTYTNKRIEESIAWRRPIKQMAVHLLLRSRRGEVTFHHVTAHVRSCDCALLAKQQPNQKANARTTRPAAAA